MDEPGGGDDTDEEKKLDPVIDNVRMAGLINGGSSPHEANDDEHLSPIRTPTAAPPGRVQSTHSLFGLDIVNSGRQSSVEDIVPTYSDDEQTTTPPSVAGRPQLSPPPLSYSSGNGDFGGGGTVHSNISGVKLVKGRPPLAPNVAAMLRGQSNASGGHHTRGPSTGEFSFMSGLTDPSDDLEILAGSTTGRHRSVSWDDAGQRQSEVYNISPGGSLPTADRSILQPILVDDEPPRSIVTDSILVDVQQESQKSDVEGRIAMADIVSPFEDEAEKAILRALEKTEHHSAPTAAVILPNVTQETAEAFRAHAESSRSVATRQESQVSDLASPLQSGDSGSERGSLGKSGAAAGPGLTSSPRYSKWSKVRPGLLSPSSSKEENSARSKRSSGGNSSPLHRRTNTLSTTGEGGSTEGKLYGMATALRDLHHREDRKHDERQAGMGLDGDGDRAKKRWERLAAHDIGQPTANIITEPKTSTDALVNNAALLFRGKLNKSGPCVRIPSQTPSKHESDPKKNDDVIHENQCASNGDGNAEVDLEMGGTPQDGSNTSSNRKKKKTFVQRCRQEVKNDWAHFTEFMKPQQRRIHVWARSAIFYVHIPLLLISALLYYLLDNPEVDFGAAIVNGVTMKPSVSWFILFLLRQTITLAMAKAMEVFTVDYLALKTTLFLRLFGPLFTLCIIQSKGWPMIGFWWSIYDLLMLSGSRKFAQHWLYYQSLIDMCNDNNSGGGVTGSVWNFRILVTAIIVCCVVAVKRFYVGVRLGTGQFNAYGAKLAKILHEMVVISEVAALAEEIEDEVNGVSYRNATKRGSLLAWGSFSGLEEQEEHDKDVDDEVQRRMSGQVQGPDIFNADNRNDFSDSLRASEKFKIHQLLDRWEEPVDETQQEKASVQAVMQFKQTLAFMDLTYPFSRAFGLADKRDHCVESAQNVYKRLLKSRLNEHPQILSFDTLTDLARNERGELDMNPLKVLVRLFRPNRDGTLSSLDFVRSVDRVYKDLKLLRAAIQNSSQIDLASEGLINVTFYFILTCAVLASWNIDPLSLFLSLSSVMLAFSFAIGSASAKYFEGILFILLRRPYDIGDRIAISGAESEPSMTGTSSWFVERVSLYHTELRLAGTNEVATITNSSMANARVINAARSTKALVYVYFKFGIDVPYSKFQVFKETLEQFIKQRPREWLSVSAIMATRVEANLGFVEYVVTLQHRESWQNVMPILQSKAAVVSYGLEVMKKLDMRFEAPPTPVDLQLRDPRLERALRDGVPASPERDAPEAPTSFAAAAAAAANLEARNRSQSADLRGLADLFAVQSSESPSR